MSEPVDRELLAGDAPDVAPQLLGRLLVVGRSGRVDVAGRIVEVEAYTSDDPASHSARGPTDRNRSMFGPPGTLYVYVSYGIHRCANVVTGAPGDGQAVLVRAVEPVHGLDLMVGRRGDVPHRRLADGPGKLCQALGIDLQHDGVDLCDGASPVRLVDDGVAPPEHPIVGPRVGISRAVDVPWRWRVPAAERRQHQCSQNP